MAINGRRGTNALDGLAARLDDDLLCPKCGYEDTAGHWKASTTGAAVVYRHACPGCGAVRELRIRMDS